MDTIHNPSEKGIECQYRMGFRARSFIRDPLASFGISYEAAPVAQMVTKWETQFPCKICSKIKWIIGTIRLHDQSVFSARVIFLQREVVERKF
jgi:hypothetical protein